MYGGASRTGRGYSAEVRSRCPTLRGWKGAEVLDLCMGKAQATLSAFIRPTLATSVIIHPITMHRHRAQGPTCRTHSIIRDACPCSSPAQRRPDGAVDARPRWRPASARCMVTTNAASRPTGSWAHAANTLRGTRPMASARARQTPTSRPSNSLIPSTTDGPRRGSNGTRPSLVSHIHSCVRSRDH